MALNPPNHRVVSLWKIQDMLADNIIKLDAPYQRDIVWQPAKMSMLIDSIMKKFYIPPLLFAVRTDDRGKSVRVCIDGKQRLTSILRFTKNEIPYLKDIEKGIVDEIYFGPSGDNTGPGTFRNKIDQRFLSEEEKDTFNDTNIVMIEFSDLEEDQELEIFARVQMGVSITAAEKLVATNSQVSKFCRDLLADHRHLDSTIRRFLGAPFKWVAQLTYILNQNDDNYVATQKRLMDFLKDREITLDNETKRKTRQTIKWLDALFQNEAGKKAITWKGVEGSNKREVLRNIEFIILGVYINKLKNSVRIPDLASDLISLRQYLNENYGPHLHTGNPCWLVGMAWIRKMMANKRRTVPATQASSSNGNCRGVMAGSDSSSTDENDVDSDETEGSGLQHRQKQPHQAPVPASKRRRTKRNEQHDMKAEEIQAAATSATQGHRNEQGKPLARRGGKKSGPSRKG